MRTGFRSRLLLRRAFAGIRSARAAEAAVALPCNRPGRAAAVRILFGDGPSPGPAALPLPWPVSPLRDPGGGI